MTRNFLLLLILFVFCNCSSDTIKKRNIINDDEFIEVLKDFHKSVGIIDIAKLYNKNNKNDTISPYNYILKKHNISREDFDKTINYYAKNTEEYVLLYDSINNYFIKEKTKFEKQIEDSLKKITPKEKFASKNLWTKKQEWVLKSITDKNTFKFNINTKYHGEYYVTANVFTMPNLPTVEKRMVLKANYEDGTSETSKNIKKTKWKKNKKIKATITTNKKKKIKSISGYIITYKKGEKRHFHLQNIEIKFVDTSKKKNLIK